MKTNTEQVEITKALDEAIEGMDRDELRMFLFDLADNLFMTNNLPIAIEDAKTKLEARRVQNTITKSSEDSETKSMLQSIMNALGLQQKPILKALDVEQKISIDIVAEPWKLDSHNDWYSEEDLVKIEKNFSSNCMRANVGHVYNTDDIEFTKSWIQPFDAEIINSDGVRQVISKGTWLIESKFHNDYLWELKKSKRMAGVSPQGLATVRTYKQDDD